MSVTFVQPLQVLHQVKEGVAVGVGTRVQHREHGDKAGVCVLDVCKRREVSLSWPGETVLRYDQANIPNALARS